MISDAITHTHTHTHTNQKTAFVIAPVRSQTFASAVPCEKRHSFLSFSYVCPEPVLVNVRFYTLMAHNMAFSHHVMAAHNLALRLVTDIVCEKTVLFFGMLSLWLSRVCLGKMVRIFT
jgi:hypothetical protein